MINRNAAVIGVCRSALNAVGARSIGRVGLLAFENLIYGSKVRIQVNGIQGDFSSSEPTLRRYLSDYENSRRGYLEQFVLNFLIDHVGPGMCFYDVGAFCGLYSVLVAKKVGDDGVVHSFELIEDNFVHLRNNLRLNGVKNAQAHLFAVQDVTTIVRFSQHGSNTDSAHSLIDIRSHLNGERPTIETVVPGVSLDDFASATGRAPDVMKIDVEGAEMRVLKGAKRILSKCRLVSCELHPKALRADGYGTEDVLTLLSQAGFRLSRVEGFRQHHGCELVPVEAGFPIERNSMVLATRDI